MARKTFTIDSGVRTGMTETVSRVHAHSGDMHIESIPISKIDLDPENPRDMLLTKDDLALGLEKSDPFYAQKKLEMDHLNSLSESIGSQGLINPILVYKTETNYKLVAGERRLLASMLGKKEAIQAKILEKKPSSLRLSLLQWVENMERSDLTLGERIKNITQIVSSLQGEKEGEAVTGDELAKAINISRSVAYNYIKVAEAPQEIHQLIHDGKIKNLEAACLIMKAEEPLRARLLELSIEGAGLAKMNALAKAFVKQPVAPAEIKQGRPSQKINFRSTTNAQVAQAIIESILQNPRFLHLKSLIETIKWENLSSVNETFKQLILALEKECK